MSSLSLTEALKVFGNRNYAIYMLGNVLSQIGDWSQRLAVGWLAWELTKSPFWLGVILFADLAPTILISPIGGALADRMDRLCLTKITLWALYFADALNIWILLVATVYLGTVHAFNQTVRLTIVPLLVPEKDISRATPLNSICFNMARFIGPAVFGLIVLVASVGYAILVNVFSYLLFAFILNFVTLRDEALAPRKKKHILSETWEGLTYAITHPGIGPLLIVLIASSFGTRAFMDLLPGFADQVFGRGPEALSMMTSATAVGAFSGALYLAMRSTTKGLATISMAASMLVGVGLIAFASIDNFYIATFVLIFVGAGLSTSAVGVLTLVQTSVKREMRGRVIAVYGIIFRGGPAIGGLAMGWIAEWTGLRWPVAGGGLLCVLVWLWVVGRLGTVRKVLEADIK